MKSQIATNIWAAKELKFSKSVFDFPAVIVFPLLKRSSVDNCHGFMSCGDEWILSEVSFLENTCFSL